MTKIKQCRTWPDAAFLGAIVFLSVVAGCSYQERKYIPNSPDPSFKSTSLKVAVIELEDGNPVAGERKFGALGAAEIPGILYTKEVEVNNPTEFGRCFATELTGAQLFARVDYFPTWEQMVDIHMEYDLIVTGILNHDTATMYATAYGLGPIGSLLWVLGAPSGSASRDVEFKLYAFRPKEPSERVWQHKIGFQDSRVLGIYYGYSDASAMAMKSWVVSTMSPDDYYIGGSKWGTDFCTTDFLQPEFKKARESLYSVIR